MTFLGLEENFSQSSGESGTSGFSHVVDLDELRNLVQVSVLWAMSMVSYGLYKALGGYFSQKPIKSGMVFGRPTFLP